MDGEGVRAETCVGKAHRNRIVGAVVQKVVLHLFWLKRYQLACPLRFFVVRFGLSVQLRRLLLPH